MDPLDHQDKMESRASPVPRVLLVLLVSLDSEERRVTVLSSVFQEQLVKRVNREIQDKQVYQGSLGLQGFQVPWDQWDLQDLLAHQALLPTLVIATTMSTRWAGAYLDSLAHPDPRVRPVLQVSPVSQVCLASTETKEQKGHGDHLGCQA